MRKRLKKQFLFFSVILISFIFLAPSVQALVVDHTSSMAFDNIPDEAIAQAKQNLRIDYGHTSHGSQIFTGTNILQGLAQNSRVLCDNSTTGNDIYQYCDDYSSPLPDGFLSFWGMRLSPAYDLANPNRTAWYYATRAQLDKPNNNRNVIMWSWSGQVATSSEENISLYLDLMAQLEQDYPNITFVYMTATLDGSGKSGNLNQRNEQIRNFVRGTDRVLYDYADIESYDPSENEFMTRLARDSTRYDGDNTGTLWDDNSYWAVEWCAAHPEETNNLCAFRDGSVACAHTDPLNCNIKARAFWWMLAKLAGWDDSSTTPPKILNEKQTEILPEGTTQAVINISTDEPAICRYSTIANTAYSNMTDTFSTTGGTTHSEIVSGLTDGNIHNYHVRCMDEFGNANTKDFVSSKIVLQTSDSGIKLDKISASVPYYERTLISSYEWNHTTTGVSNTVLIVGISTGYGTTGSTSVEYAGMLLTYLASNYFGSSSANYSRVDVWYLLNPPVGEHTIKVNINPASRVSTAGAVTYLGVNLSNPFGNILKTSAWGTSASIAIPSNPGEIVLDFISRQNDVTTDPPNPGANQSLLWIRNTNLASNSGAYGAGSSKPGQAITTMSWSWVGSTKGAALLGFALKPFSGVIIPDTTLPLVTITSPLNNSNVSGTVNLNATASDNIGVLGVQFKLDGNNLGTEDTSQPYSVSWNTTTLTNGLHTLTAVARDVAGNTAQTLIFANVNNVAPPADISAPVRSNGNPSNTLSSGTTQATISLSTNENAICRYSTTAGTEYNSMTNTFSTTGSTVHSTLVSGLSDGNTYNFYVRCADSINNVNTNDYTITFSVANAPLPPPPSNGTGIEFDSANSDSTGNSSSATLNWSHVVGPGENRILVVSISTIIPNNRVLRSVKYGENNLTRLGMSSFQSSAGVNLSQVEVFYLLNPPVGTDNVSFVWSGTMRVVGGSSSYSGVSQITPFGQISARNGSSNNATITGIASSSGEWVLDFLARSSDSDSFGVPAPGTGQTELWLNKTNMSATTWVGNGVVGAGSSKPADNENMSWAWASRRDWAALAVPMHRS